MQVTRQWRNSVGLSKEKCTLRGMLHLLKTSGDVQMLFGTVKQLAEGLQILVTLKVEKSLNCLVSTWRATVPITDKSQFCS